MEFEHLGVVSIHLQIAAGRQPRDARPDDDRLLVANHAHASTCWIDAIAPVGASSENILDQIEASIRRPTIGPASPLVGWTVKMVAIIIVPPPAALGRRGYPERTA